MTVPTLSFSSAHPSLARTLTARGYNEPTAVQAAILAEEDGRDLLVSAQTGSGKTVAFGLALAGPLLGDAATFKAAGAPRALIVTPTRELALQVHRELAWLYAETNARITTCVGGMDPRRESQLLSRGVHIVVGTPGRLCDHLERGSLDLSKLEAVVLDEADEMLDMGFREDLERLLQAAPATRRTLLFSATIPKDIAAMAKRYQRDAKRVATTNERERHADIAYAAVVVTPRERDLAVVNLLRYHEAPGAIVFCATRDGVTHLAANLAERGFSVAALSGELSQRERNMALQALRDGRARVCVATDVAARGLDLPDLGIVIHADLPQNKEVLVHRSGRTGRAGRKGVAILIVPDPARRYAERLFHAAHIDPAWSSAPTADAIRVRDQAQLAVEVRAMTTEPTDEDREVARTLLTEHSAEALVAALVHQRRQLLPAPEELTVPASLRPSRTDRFAASSGAAQRGRESAHGEEVPDRGRPRAPQSRPEPRHERHEARHDTRPDTRPARSAPAPRGRQNQGDGMVWFSINVGRSKNADPKWIVPLLCRRGKIGKQDIGKIQVFARETRVEIAAAASERFAEAVRVPDAKDRNIHIEPVDDAIG